MCRLAGGHVGAMRSQTTNPSALTDWLIMHPQCVLDLHPLFIYLCYERMIAMTAKAHLLHILSFVFCLLIQASSFHPANGTMMLEQCVTFSIGSACKRLYIPSACCWILNTFFFFAQDKSLPSNVLHTFFFFFKGSSK